MIVRILFLLSLPRRSGTGRHRSSLVLLETRAAQHRPALRGSERNCGFQSAGRALGSCFGSYPGTAVGALRLALLTALGVVFKILVVKEELLARCEDEFGAAINTLEYFIREFHGRFPQKQGTC